MDLDVLPVRNHNVLYMCITAAVVIAMVLIACFWRRKGSLQQPTGFLQVATVGFVNVIEDAPFPGVPLRMLRLERSGATVWWKAFVDVQKTRFHLLTQVGGVVYAWKEGQPDVLGLPWGAAWIGPIGQGRNLVFTETKSSGIGVDSHAFSPTEDLKLLTYDAEFRLTWNATHRVGKLHLTQQADL